MWGTSPVQNSWAYNQPGSGAVRAGGEYVRSHMTIFAGSPQGHREAWREDAGDRRSQEATSDSKNVLLSSRSTLGGPGRLYSGRADQTVTHQTARSMYLSWEGLGTWGLERSTVVWGFAQSLCYQTTWAHIPPPSPDSSAALGKPRDLSVPQFSHL